MQRGLAQTALVPEPDEEVSAEERNPASPAARDYLELYGFSRAPFAADIPQGGFVLGESHRTALEALAGAMLAGRSAVVLTGEGQTGKTSLLQTAIGMVTERSVHVVRVCNQAPGPLSLKRLLSRVLDIEEPIALPQADSDRAHAVLTTPPPGATHIVLAIDDADTLSVGSLRYLTKLVGRGPQLVLVGAPAVWPLLRQGEFRPLTRRIGVRLRITRLTAEEVRSYIERRLWMAGSETRKVLTPSAMAELVVRTEGIPGRINAALDRVFVTGFEYGHQRITPQTLRVALGLPRPPTIRPSAPRKAPPIWLIAGTSLALGVGAALYANRTALPDPSSVLAWVTAQAR
jgi:general secretion pathway protein A